MNTGTGNGKRTGKDSGLGELADAVLTASRVLVAVAARSLAEEESISLPQYRALVVLASRGQQRAVDLALALNVDPSTITRMCDRLEGKLLITRQRDEDDRRIVVLDLSAGGQRLVDRVTNRRRNEIEQILTAIEPTERTNLIRAFTIFGKAAGEIPEKAWQRSWEL